MTEQVERCAWVLLYLDDLDADFARYYRREWHEHSGPQFFARARRLAAYGGVMTNRLHALQAETEPATPEPDEIPDVLDMVNDPAYAGMVEVG